MKLKIRKYVVLEIILIFSSILIFRSFWHLLDKIDFFDNTFVLFLSFFIGISLAIISFKKLKKMNFN